MRVFCAEDSDASGVTASEACIVACASGDVTGCAEYDNCWDSPCKNSGACTDGVGTYTCDCPPEFTGREFTPVCEPWPLHYTIMGCSDESHCGVFTRVPANCAYGDRCPGGQWARPGLTDATMCDGVPTFQAGGPDGPVLFRVYSGGSTTWFVGSSGVLNDCEAGDRSIRYYLGSAWNYRHPLSSRDPLGGAPTALKYSAGDGWIDYDNGALGTITVTAGDGSATSGGGGGGH
jgi:hypothetical protein